MGLLKEIFGPSKKDIWEQIAQEIGGEYIDGGFWKKDGLRLQHREWELLLDTFTRGSNNNSRTYTRLRVPFLNKDGLRFKIYHESIFSSIGKFLGAQDIEIGDPYFDDTFIIKGNNENTIYKLLKDEQLKNLFMNQPKVLIEIKNNEGWFGPHYPEGVDVLYFESYGVMKKKDELFNLFELFSTLLDRLVHIDSAYENNPGIELK